MPVMDHIFLQSPKIRFILEAVLYLKQSMAAKQITNNGASK